MKIYSSYALDKYSGLTEAEVMARLLDVVVVAVML